MATSFKSLQKLLHPSVNSIQSTEDSVYWKNLEFPVTIKHPGSVTHIDFSPIQPFNYIVTASTRVQLYSSKTNLPIKTYHHFAESARSACFRGDGQLIVAGSDDKKIRVLHEKHFEQVLEGHEGPVHATKFLDNFKIISASDDKSSKIWDIGTKSIICSFQENTDYNRCISSADNSDIFITGSYDHSVKLYDQRCPTSLKTFNHDGPVESVLMYPGGRLIASASGTEISIWDIVSSRKLASCSNHHKTITHLTFCSHNQRLVSASLDRHLKFYDLLNYKIVHTLDYSSGILSTSFAPDDSYISVGCVDGLLSTRRKTPISELTDKLKPKKRSRNIKGPVMYCPLGKPLVKSENDATEFVATHEKRIKLTKHDKYLKKFKYTKAFDEVMEITFRSKNPDTTISVLKELDRRNGLASALAGRDDHSLASILTFILKNFFPPYLPVLMDLLLLILEIYVETLDEMMESMQLLRKLVDATRDRIAFQTDSMEVAGCLKMMLHHCAKTNEN